MSEKLKTTEMGIARMAKEKNFADIETLGTMSRSNAYTLEHRKRAIQALAGFSGDNAGFAAEQIVSTALVSHLLPEFCIKSLSGMPVEVAAKGLQAIGISQCEFQCIDALEAMDNDMADQAIGVIGRGKPLVAKYAFQILQPKETDQALISIAEIGKGSDYQDFPVLHHLLNVMDSFNEAAKPEKAGFVKDLIIQNTNELTKVDKFMARIDMGRFDREELGRFFTRMAKIPELNSVGEYYKETLQVMDVVKALNKTRISIFPQ